MLQKGCLQNKIYRETYAPKGELNFLSQNNLLNNHLRRAAVR
jgi:hypothetical protein